MNLDYDQDWCHSVQLNEEGSRIASFEAKAYRESHGYMATQNPDAYEGYDLKTLKALGEQGDLTALYVLSSNSGLLNDVKLHEEALHTSIIHGSTRALVKVGASKLRDAKRSKSNGVWSRIARKKAMEAMAYFEVGALRGNWHVVSEGIRAQKKYGLVFSEDDLGEISSLAEKIYIELAAERETRALPPFDNSTPKASISTNQLLLAKHIAQDWSGWGTDFLDKVAGAKCVREKIALF